jgi:hypothetical protein
MEESRIRTCYLYLCQDIIQNIIPKFESFVGGEFKPVKTPMCDGYHPEMDDTQLCTDEDSAKYRS